MTKAGALFGMGTLVVIPGDEFNVPVLDGDELLGMNVLSVVTNSGVDVRPMIWSWILELRDGAVCSPVVRMMSLMRILPWCL